MVHQQHANRFDFRLLLFTPLLLAGIALSTVSAQAADSHDPETALPAAPMEPASAVTQQPAPPAAASPSADLPAPSQNVTINLINRLVQRGVLPKEDAAELIKQAENDAATARAQAAAVPPPMSDDTMRVTYVPEVVKTQIRDDLKDEVMKQARDENWANPRTLPPWVTKLRLFGDFRIRSQNDIYPSGNLTGQGSNFWNYNAINTNATPYDYTGQSNPPIPNADQDRYRLRLRARVGVEADLDSGFTAGIRIGTGENSAPVSQNQTLGNSGGDFSKYAVWLDRGFLKYELGDLTQGASVVVGRFDNPFFTTKMIWNDEIGFDGVALQAHTRFFDCISPFLVGGAFPVYNSDLNFATYSPTKYASHDKWLDAIQAGIEWKINKDVTAKFACAYYDFQNIAGEVSTPFTPLTNLDAGDTDITRPSFAQKGNTYIALRDIESNVNNSYGTTNQWQYFGLATPFRELALTGRIDYNHFDPFHVWIEGEYVCNEAFDRNAILNAGPPELPGPINNLGTNGVYGGGNAAWILTLNLGNLVLERAWDWNASIGYRYVETDAVVDGFCEDNFGGGGTNLKGFTIGANLGLSPKVSLGFHWMSADSVAGVPFKQDVLQVDLNAKF